MKDSYSAQASRIMSKYKIRLGKDFDKDDTLARQGLELEMNALKEKQEATKITMVSRKKKYGGSILPKYDDTQPYSSQLDEIDANYIDPEAEALMNTYRTNEDIDQQQDELYKPTLSAIPLATSLLGNALLLGDNKAENIKYDRVNIKPELISLAREREAARRTAELNRNSASRTARNLGLSGGAAATIANAANVDISRGLGEQVGKSYLNEELSNKEAINRASMMNSQMNAEIGMREKDANLREKDSVKNTKTAAIQGIIGNIGDYFADTSKARQYNDLTQMISDDYKYYEDPEQSLWNKVTLGSRKKQKYTGTYKQP